MGGNTSAGTSASASAAQLARGHCCATSKPVELQNKTSAARVPAQHHKSNRAVEVHRGMSTSTSDILVGVGPGTEPVQSKLQHNVIAVRAQSQYREKQTHSSRNHPYPRAGLARPRLDGPLQLQALQWLPLGGARRPPRRHRRRLQRGGLAARGAGRGLAQQGACIDTCSAAIVACADIVVGAGRAVAVGAACGLCRMAWQWPMACRAHMA